MILYRINSTIPYFRLIGTMNGVRRVRMSCETCKLCSRTQEAHVVYIHRLTAVNMGDGLVLLVESIPDSKKSRKSSQGKRARSQGHFLPI